MTASDARPSHPRVEWRDVDGILLLDKPLGASSNQALQRARRLYRARKAGHTGSLDPLASGVLPLCFGAATRVSAFLLDADKTYRARLQLGARTTTGDAEGEVAERAPVPALASDAIRAACASLVGPYRQVPPMYSALKRDGRPLYELARAGREVEREARDLVLHRLEPIEFGDDWFGFEVRCSKGTYVRTLGEDLARLLGTVGHLAALRRTAVGPFAGLPVVGFEALDAAADLDALDARLLPADAALAGLPAVTLDEAGDSDVRHGRPTARTLAGLPDAAAPAGARVRLYAPAGAFVGLGTVAADGVSVAPNRVFAGVG